MTETTDLIPTIDIEAIKTALRAEIGSTDHPLLKQAISAITFLEEQNRVMDGEVRDTERQMRQQIERAVEAEDKLYVARDLSDLERIGVYPGSKRPKNEQNVHYFFEPHGTWFTGTYYASGDSVSGSCGFSSWLPEVLYWAANGTRGPDIIVDSLVDKIEKLKFDLKRFQSFEKIHASNIPYNNFFNATDLRIQRVIEQGIEMDFVGQSPERLMRELRTITLNTPAQSGKTDWATRKLRDSNDFLMIRNSDALKVIEHDDQITTIIDDSTLTFKYVIIDQADSVAGREKYEQLVRLVVDNWPVNTDMRIIRLG